MLCDLDHDVIISIHALREEGDRLAVRMPEMTSDFYPRPPRGGRRPGGVGGKSKQHISIHALREEGDCQRVGNQIQSQRDFYPRPPRGGRRRR